MLACCCRGGVWGDRMHSCDTVMVQALQTSGNFEEAYELCLMAQKVVDQSVEKVRGIYGTGLLTVSE